MSVRERDTDLTVFVRPEITEPRLARQWSAIEQDGLPVGNRHYGLWLAALVALPCMVVLLHFGRTALPQTMPTGGAAFSARDPVTVSLRDGSSVELSARTQLRLLRDADDAVELELGEGKARFDVSHQRNRSFTVRADAALVQVVGTRFEVTRLARAEGTIVKVSVERGIVDVRRVDLPSGVRRLSAGEDWSVFLPKRSPMADAVSPDAEDVGETQFDEVFEPLDVSPVDDRHDQDEARSTPSDRGRTASTGDGSKALFARASAARRAGQMREAAALYADLIERHPRDARVAVSAFELGRIRMDALGDPRGSIDALAQAVRRAPEASFREDALARMALAHEALGDRAECKRLRAVYLSSYPTGIHAVTLTARCGP